MSRTHYVGYRCLGAPLSGFRGIRGFGADPEPAQSTPQEQAVVTSDEAGDVTTGTETVKTTATGPAEQVTTIKAQWIAPSIDYRTEPMVVRQINHNSSCPPRTAFVNPEDYAKMACSQKMTSWWVVQGKGGRILYASSDEDGAHAWMAQKKAPVDQTLEPTPDMVVPGGGTGQARVPASISAPPKKILGMDPKTAALAGGGALLAILLLK